MSRKIESLESPQLRPQDPQYKRWPKALRTLLQPSWSLVTLSRNLYTMVMIVDPTTEAGLGLLHTIEGLHKQVANSF